MKKRETAGNGRREWPINGGVPSSRDDSSARPHLLLATLAVASHAENEAQTRRWTQSSANCRSFLRRHHSSGEQYRPHVDHRCTPANQVLVQILIDSYAVGSTVLTEVLEGPAVDGTYSLYFKYFEPTSGNPTRIFQTHHGLVSNAAYWNVQLDGKTDNSFVESAAEAGWATLSYDRLGVGNSLIPSRWDQYCPNLL